MAPEATGSQALVPFVENPLPADIEAFLSLAHDMLPYVTAAPEDRLDRESPGFFPGFYALMDTFILTEFLLVMKIVEKKNEKNPHMIFPEPLEALVMRTVQQVGADFPDDEDMSTAAGVLREVCDSVTRLALDPCGTSDILPLQYFLERLPQVAENMRPDLLLVTTGLYVRSDGSHGYYMENGPGKPPTYIPYGSQQQPTV